MKITVTNRLHERLRRDRLTPSQLFALDQLMVFLASPSDRVFLLKGYAGTGKTFLLGYISAWLAKKNRAFHLLAPTGRAARVLQKATGYAAQTIHRHIYSLSDWVLDKEDEDHPVFVYKLRNNEDDARCVYLVDEGSLIPNQPFESEYLRFGSGFVLNDLLAYCFQNIHAKLIISGDPAQLPPVGDNLSPALDLATYTSRNINAREAELTEVVRQAEDSPILKLATKVREDLRAGYFGGLRVEQDPPAISFAGPADDSEILPDSLPDSSMPPEVIICYSNKSCLHYNQRVRERLFKNPDVVEPGDCLMAISNCCTPDIQIMNGQFVRVLEVDREIHRVRVRLKSSQKASSTADGPGGPEESPEYVEPITLVFRKVRIQTSSTNDDLQTAELFLLENSLLSDKSNISREEWRALYVNFLQRNSHVTNDSNVFAEILREDPFYNALRAKYAYAITCHRAQGGEWRKVVVDCQTNNNPKTPFFYRWFYTAVTRTREKLVLINPPNDVFREIQILTSPGIETLVPQREVDAAVASFLPKEWLGSSPYQKLMACHLATLADSLGYRVLEIAHRPFLAILIVEKGAAQLRIDLNYNKRGSITRISPERGADLHEFAPLLDRLHQNIRLSLVEKTSADTPKDLPLDEPPLEPSIPFPSPAANPAIARFDEWLRGELQAVASIAKIEILNQFHARYEFKRGHQSAVFQFYFNRHGVCTSAMLDPRRTTHPELGQKIQKIFAQSRSTP